MIFVDTSFWVALRLKRDQRHADAVALWEAHSDAGLVTSTFVRGETWTFLRRRAGHASAVGYLDAIEGSERVSLVAAPDDVDRIALGWLRRRDDREFSYVDATSFAIMRARKIISALAFDGDFQAAGFAELQPAT